MMTPGNRNKKGGGFVPVDILLDGGGDILISETADIVLKPSIRQEIKIRLQWFFREWRFAPDVGLPYFEEVFIKNPNPERIVRIVREEAAKVDGVIEIRDVRVNYDSKTRNAVISFTVFTTYDTFREEIGISG